MPSLDLTGLQMDALRKYPNGHRPRGRDEPWSHLWCAPEDPAARERLHTLAKSLGLRRSWFQDRRGFPHYDLTEGMHWKAHRAGVPTASLVDWIKARDGIMERAFAATVQAAEVRSFYEV